MTQEEKQLLVKTLCAMLPYGIQAQVPGHVNPLQILGITKLHKGTWAWKRGKYIVSFWNDTCSIETIKPYIRPMSSMTEKEDIECSELVTIYDMTDWFYAHRFDVHNLIEKGLALKAPEGMYKTE